MNKPNLLARIFSRGSESTVVGKLYAAAIGRPLLIHAGMGEQLIGAYLEGATDVQEPAEARPIIMDAGQLAVINVSGPLINRPMPDACGDGPISYEVLRTVFDAAIADSNITAIVFRIESPGGMASGCFDLADHIFASRGTKPIYAVIDDYAYSGGFCIAAACDEIWISRTGGVGSVGVVTFHRDVTGADAQAGIKITPIFAGDRKVDWNPHIALSEDAMARAQMEVDGLAALFQQSVGTYLGMDPGVVAATQAETYRGQEAIDIGFATRLGTMRDLLAQLSNPPAMPIQVVADTDDGEGVDVIDVVDVQSGALDKLLAVPDVPLPAVEDTDGRDVPGVVEQRPDNAAAGEQVDGQGLPPVAVVAVDAEQLRVHAKAAMVDALTTSTLPPALIGALLKREIVVDQIATAIADAGRIADICAAAKLPNVAADYVARAVDVDTVRAELIAAVADVGQEIVTALPVAGSPGGTSIAAGAWGETIKRFGG